MTPGRLLTGLAAGLFACALAPTLASAEAPQHPACRAPSDLIRLSQPLPHIARHLARGEPVTIVAIGSSSTAGAGASSPAASYPSQLQVDLQAEFPRSRITVINLGVNGEEMPDMLARFAEVINDKPDLVLWQVGTNSVLRDHPVAPADGMITEGVQQLRAIGADVVMIDPQYAPRVIAKAEAPIMVRQISESSKEANVDLFQRFAVMRDWHDAQHLDFADFVSPDGLHMNDWGYACLAKLIGASITEATTRGVASAAVAPTLGVTP